MPFGSSPLTRGKREDIGGRSVRDGLIPAHAGKTSVHPLVVACPAAHPRSRGENSRAAAMSSFAAGSSPLTRGKHDGPSAPVADVRLIPAHAGKT